MLAVLLGMLSYQACFSKHCELSSSLRLPPRCCWKNPGRNSGSLNLATFLFPNYWPLDGLFPPNEDVSSQGSCCSSCSISILLVLSAVVWLPWEKCPQDSDFSPRVLSLPCIYIYRLYSSIFLALLFSCWGGICRKQRQMLFNHFGVSC